MQLQAVRRGYWPGMGASPDAAELCRRHADSSGMGAQPQRQTRQGLLPGQGTIRQSCFHLSIGDPSWTDFFSRPGDFSFPIVGFSSSVRHSLSLSLISLDYHSQNGSRKTSSQIHIAQGHVDVQAGAQGPDAHLRHHPDRARGVNCIVRSRVLHSASCRRTSSMVNPFKSPHSSGLPRSLFHNRSSSLSSGISLRASASWPVADIAASTQVLTSHSTSSSGSA